MEEGRWGGGGGGRGAEWELSKTDRQEGIGPRIERQSETEKGRDEKRKNDRPTGSELAGERKRGRGGRGSE